MKKFKFQLDTVLRYKNQVLDIRLAEHGSALAAVRRQEAVLEQARRNRIACEEEYRRKKAEGITIADSMKYETGIEVLERRVQREAGLLKELQKALTETFDVLVCKHRMAAKQSDKDRKDGNRQMLKVYGADICEGTLQQLPEKGTGQQK